MSSPSPARPWRSRTTWYAQDRCGNGWYLGEATTEYVNGKPVSTSGSFEAGVDGAQAGVIMPAAPRPGMRYRQEYYEDEAEDRAEIVSLGAQVEVPYGHFRQGRVLTTRDLNPLDPKILEFKFYARGITPVLAVGVSGGSAANVAGGGTEVWLELPSRLNASDAARRDSPDVG